MPVQSLFSFGKKKEGTTGSNGRSTFIPVIDSPGPAAYDPKDDYTVKQAGRTCFSQCDRDHEEARFISEVHQRSVPAKGMPGPGTYRTNRMGRKFLSRSAPSWSFGSSAQRTDGSKLPAAQNPAPIYDQTLPTVSRSHSFAPPGYVKNGSELSRNNKLFISKGHAEADRTYIADPLPYVAPGAYEQVPQETVYKSSGTYKFGKSSRDAFDSFDKVQQKLTPLAGTPGMTPAAKYDTSEKWGTGKSVAFGSGSKFYQPESGGSKAGPYIGKGHETANLGSASPGPASYTLEGSAPSMGDGTKTRFGTSERTPMVRQKVPGPGAYAPRDVSSSIIKQAPSYSLGGGFGRGEQTSSATRDSPAPGAYSPDNKCTTEVHKAASYSIGVRLLPDLKPDKVPGPLEYSPKSGDSTGKNRGYSFGVREKTINPQTTVSFRYQGSVGASEGMGTHSPGPGVYDVRHIHTSDQKKPQSMKFATSGRDAGSKMFISKMHAEADGLGAESPGPGCYDLQEVEVATVTSKYKRSTAAAFSTTDRFGAACMTF